MDSAGDSSDEREFWLRADFTRSVEESELLPQASERILEFNGPQWSYQSMKSSEQTGAQRLMK
jgi:hypothetical protein